MARIENSVPPLKRVARAFKNLRQLFRHDAAPDSFLTPQSFPWKTNGQSGRPLGLLALDDGHQFRRVLRSTGRV
ncbi:MAG TPA: hypothetical protein VKH82_05885 [Candidatus Binatia bacterium]|nr:hypothetical protein [Candidatus Binatia bacterium]